MLLFLVAQVPFTGAGDRMRRQRRILTKAIGTGSIKTYEPILEGESRDFVQNLTKPAMDFRKTVLRFAHFALFFLPGRAADGRRFLVFQVQRWPDAAGVVRS
jgi:cytochrome P450